VVVTDFSCEVGLGFRPEAEDVSERAGQVARL
jgi:hypothetical protein